MNQKRSMMKITLVAIAVLVGVAWTAGVAVYFYNARDRLAAQRAVLPAPPAIKKVEHVHSGLFEQDFELTLSFDDGSKLTGTASAQCTGSPLSGRSGEMLAHLLTDQTGILWLTVEASGKDYKKEWTSKVIETGQYRTLQVRFKIYK